MRELFKVTLKEILEASNIQAAIEHLQTKRNSCGIDGIYIHDLTDYWSINREAMH